MHVTNNPLHKLMDNHTLSPASLVLCLLGWFLFLHLLRGILMPQLVNLGCLSKSFMEPTHSSAMDTGTDSYWTCLKGIDQKAWYADELHLRDKHNIKCIDDKALAKLKTAKSISKMQGAPNYNLLYNQEYIDRFQYIGIQNRADGKEFELADNVTCALSLSPHF